MTATTHDAVESVSPWIVSCEHATHHVPAAWLPWFEDQALLHSHRGWDPGAAQVARFLGRHLPAPVLLARVSRLLADTNRSAGHPEVHAAVLRSLPRQEKAAILAAWHQPYQQQVMAAVAAALDAHPRVIHISCHSFTPQLHGVRRNADIGLLYDPGHGDEGPLARRWQTQLQRGGRWRIRRNYPYRGRADGMTRILRRRHGSRYRGIELELNQALLTDSGDVPRALLDHLLVTLKGCVDEA